MNNKLRLLIFAIGFSSLHAQIIRTIAGNGSTGSAGDGGDATSATFMIPRYVTVDVAGNIFVSDQGANVIRKIDASGIVSTFAGTGIAGFSGNGGPATTAQLSSPKGITSDISGNIYIVDNNRIRKINTAGIISTYAGSGSGGSGGDGGPALQAGMDDPTDIACDGTGNIYLAESASNKIRKIDTSGIITSVVNSIGAGFGYSGDGGLAADAQLYYPLAIATDNDGNLYIADAYNFVIRKVDTAGIITTVGGNHVFGYSGNGGPATQAMIGIVLGITSDSNGNIYFSDNDNNMVRKIDSVGVITNFAGDGTQGYTGDGGPANVAHMAGVRGLTRDSNDNIYIACETSHVIRMVGSCVAETPEICVVSVDSTYTNNEVHWEKSNYTDADSFIIYRHDVVTSSYLKIGVVPGDVGSFTDTARSVGGPNGGNPFYSSWKYKLAIKNNCGNISSKSPYHQTMFLQKNGQNFSWNNYNVEAGQTNTVTGYSFLRDDANTGNWQVLVNTSSQSTTDPNYSSFPNGNWRVDALGFNCSSGFKLSGNNNIQTIYTRSRSNPTSVVPVSAHQEIFDENLISVYPNPCSSVLFVDDVSVMGEKEINITDAAGRTILKGSILPNKQTISIENLSDGIYFLHVKTEKGIVTRKIIVQR
jgi:hypothetical protein